MRIVTRDGSHTSVVITSVRVASAGVGVVTSAVAVTIGGTSLVGLTKTIDGAVGGAVSHETKRTVQVAEVTVVLKGPYMAISCWPQTGVLCLTLATGV